MSEGIEVVIGKDVRDILNNFRKINAEIVFNKEETSVSGLTFAKCTGFAMPTTFGISSINKLLRLLKKVGTDTIWVRENQLYIEKKLDNGEVRCAELPFYDGWEESIDYLEPGFDDEFKENPDAVFKLSENDIKDIKDADKDSSYINIKIVDNVLDILMGSTGDGFKITREIDYDGEVIDLVFTPNDFNFLPGDYTANVFSDGFVVFKKDAIYVDEEEIDMGIYYYLSTGLDE